MADFYYTVCPTLGAASLKIISHPSPYGHFISGVFQAGLTAVSASGSSALLGVAQRVFCGQPGADAETLARLTSHFRLLTRVTVALFGHSLCAKMSPLLSSPAAVCCAQYDPNCLKAVHRFFHAVRIQVPPEQTDECAPLSLSIVAGCLPPGNFPFPKYGCFLASSVP